MVKSRTLTKLPTKMNLPHFLFFPLLAKNGERLNKYDDNEIIKKEPYTACK